MSEAIHLGYEVGTGAPVAVPLKHTAVTGQTQESGKTTTLEALHAQVRGQLKRTGPDVNNASLGKTLADYVSKGFLVRDGGGFKSAGAKVRVEEK